MKRERGLDLSDKRSEAVLDASVLVQAVVREEYTEVALRLIGVLKTIYAPSLVLYEIANTLVMLVRRRLLAEEDAMRKFNHIIRIPTFNIKDPELSRAMDIAMELELTVYDASYLALALETETPLITADNTLCDKGRRIAKVVHVSEADGYL